MAAKPSPSGSATVERQKSSKTYGSFFLEYSLMAEYKLLHKQTLPGVYVIPSARTPLLWFGVIFIRQGLYQSGIFKFCVLIPANYPDGDCPKVLFDHAPFHPLIDPKSGRLDVERAFPSWTRNVHHIWNVLLYTRRIFYKIETKSPLNPEAAVLYERQLTQYKNAVVKSIELNQNHLYDKPRTSDPYEIQFVRENDGVIVEQKKAMLGFLKKEAACSSDSNLTGLSWVARGTSLPFSKSFPIA